MRAIVVDRFMKPSELSLGQFPDPEPRPGELVLRVEAAAVNFADTLIIQGKYQEKPALPFVPGGEVAGIVERIAEPEGRDDPAAIREGDRVMAYIGRGGFAERARAPLERVHRIADAMSFEEAAAFPIVYGTAYAAVALRGALRTGENLLVTAASGGVGLATIQVAKALGGRVIALASGDKLDVALETGADVAVDYKAADWVERVKAETGGRGADVIIENVGGDIFDGCTRCIAWGGRIVISGFASGRIPEVRLNRVMLKHIAIVGLHFGPLHDHEPGAVRGMYRELFALYRAGALSPRVSEVFPLGRAADALEALASGRTTGKIVLRP